MSILQSLPPGTIIDSDIVKAAQAGELIIENFDIQSVKQACYELHAGEVFYETLKSEEDRRKEISSGFYILKPKGLVTVIVKEKIQLPANVMARILTKGQLFSIGISPVNTYADPGFDGKLGIILHNVSTKFIKIKPGDPIAKIEFSVLNKNVQRTYSGQHGYETKIWPIRNDLYATKEDLLANRISTSDEVLIGEMYGPEVARIAEKVIYYSRMVWIQIFVTVAFILGLLALKDQVSLSFAIFTGVASNLLTTVVSGLLKRTKFWRE